MKLEGKDITSTMIEQAPANSVIRSGYVIQFNRDEIHVIVLYKLKSGKFSLYCGTLSKTIEEIIRSKNCVTNPHWISKYLHIDPGILKKYWSGYEG